MITLKDGEYYWVDGRPIAMGPPRADKPFFVVARYQSDPSPRWWYGHAWYNGDSLNAIRHIPKPRAKPRV
jgi:hypothetical protein